MRHLLLAIGVSLAFTACGQCRSSADCNSGEHCNLDNGECAASCRSNADCASTAICDLEIGRCEPKMRPSLFPPEDGSTPDVDTSTAADAEAGD